MNTVAFPPGASHIDTIWLFRCCITSHHQSSFFKVTTGFDTATAHGRTPQSPDRWGIGFHLTRMVHTGDHCIQRTRTKSNERTKNKQKRTHSEGVWGCVYEEKHKNAVMVKAVSVWCCVEMLLHTQENVGSSGHTGKKRVAKGKKKRVYGV